MQKYAVETFDLTKVYEVRKKLEHGFIKRLRAVKGLYVPLIVLMLR